MITFSLFSHWTEDRYGRYGPKLEVPSTHEKLMVWLRRGETDALAHKPKRPPNDEFKVAYLQGYADGKDKQTIKGHP